MRSSIAVLLLLVLPIAAQATDIRSQSYSYNYDVASSVLSDNTYLLCDDCASDTLVVQRPVRLAIRFTAPFPSPAPMTESVSAETAPIIPQEKKCESPYPLTTVHFRLNSATLSQTEGEKLRKALSEEYTKLWNISLLGYTCDLGTTDYNMKLSLKRARTVDTFLKGLGLEVASVEGRGETNLLSCRDKALNRRVEVILKKKETISEK